jgi:hypothetical protein
MVYDFIIDSDILEYMKNKNLVIHLVTIYKNNNYIDSEDITSDDDNYKQLTGIARVKLSEIISNTDFTSKNILITSKNSPNVLLGQLNVDIKLENTNAIEYISKEKTARKSPKTMKESNTFPKIASKLPEIEYESTYKTKYNQQPKLIFNEDDLLGTDALWEKLKNNTVNIY